MIPEGRLELGRVMFLARMRRGHLGSSKMRRLLSFLLVALFGLAPAAALLPGSEEAQLPTCCRRHGAHHCTMGIAAAGVLAGGAHRVSAPTHCPLYHGTTPATTIAFALPARPVIARQWRTFAAVRIAQAPILRHAGACCDRGPPVDDYLG
jgi:hypothetical protein